MLFKWASYPDYIQPDTINPLVGIIKSANYGNLPMKKRYTWKVLCSELEWKLIMQILFQPKDTDEYSQSPRFQGKASRSGFKHGTLIIRDSALPMSYPDYIQPDTINPLFGIIRSANFRSLPMKTRYTWKLLCSSANMISTRIH